MYFLDRFIDNIFSVISKKILGKSINTPSPRANPFKLFDLYMEFFAIKLSHFFICCKCSSLTEIIRKQVNANLGLIDENSQSNIFLLFVDQSFH